jgi:hypothetical protein
MLNLNLIGISGNRNPIDPLFNKVGCIHGLPVHGDLLHSLGSPGSHTGDVQQSAPTTLRSIKSLRLLDARQLYGIASGIRQISEHCLIPSHIDNNHG